MALDQDVFDSLIFKLEVQVEDQLAKLALAGKVMGQVERSVGTLSRKEEMLNKIRIDSATAVRRQFESSVRYRKDLDILNDLLSTGAINLREYKRELKEVQRAYIEAGNPATKFANTLTKMSRRARRVGRNLTLFVTLPLAGLAGAAVKSFTEFDQALIQTQTLLGETPEAMQPMRDMIKELSFSGEVIQGPAELASVTDELARSGRDVQQSMETLNVISTFATATRSDLEKATNELVESQEALGMASDNSAQSLANITRIANLYAEASRFGQTESLNFAKAINNQAGPTLRQFGVDLEEGMAALVAYAKQGTVGAEAGTFLSRAYLLLSKAANTSADAHKRLGFQVFDEADGKIHLADVSRQLTEITKGLTKEQTAAMLKMLGFEQRSQRVLLPLIGMANVMDTMEDRFRNTGNVIDGMAKQQMEALSAKLTVVWNKFKVLVFGIVEKVLPAIERAIEGATDLMDEWDELSGATQNLIVALAGVAASAGPLLFLLGSLGSATANTITMFNKLMIAADGVGASALAAKASLGILIIGGIAALTVAVMKSVEALVEWATGLNNVEHQVRELISLNKELQDSVSKGEMKQIADVAGIEDHEERIKKAKELQEVFEKNRKTLMNTVHENKNRMKDIVESGTVVTPLIELERAYGKIVASRFDPTVIRKQAQELIEESPAFTDQANKLEELAFQIERLGATEENLEAVKDIIKQTTEEMENQEKAQEQMRKNRQIFKEMKADFDDPQAMTRFWKKLEQSVLNYEKSLDKAGETVRQSVLTPQEKLNEKMEMLDNLLMRGKISWETYSRAVKKAGEEADKTINKDFNDQVDKGKKLMEEFATPQEKFNKRMEELKELRAGGFIDFDTFKQAAMKAKETMDETLGKDKTIDVRFRLKDIEGVEARSAEAFSRLRKTFFLGRDTASTTSIDLTDPFKAKETPTDVFKDSGQNIQLIKEGIDRLIEIEEEMQAQPIELVPTDIA